MQNSIILALFCMFCLASATFLPRSFECPEAQNGDVDSAFAHPENCNMYYECTNGVAVAKTCEPGTYFNEEKPGCDISDNSTCEVAGVKEA